MDIDVMIAFGIGLFLGTITGIFLAALMVVAGNDRRNDE